MCFPKRDMIVCYKTLFCSTGAHFQNLNRTRQQEAFHCLLHNIDLISYGNCVFSGVLQVQCFVLVRHIALMECLMECWTCLPV